MNDITAALDGEAGGDQTPLWISLPPGYFELPLDAAAQRLQQAETLMTDIAEASEHARIQEVTGTLAVFLTVLATGGALYCGIGRHTSEEDGTQVSSTLVVSYQEYEGTRNPRLLLNNILQAKAADDEHGQADLVEMAERPVLFFERTRQLPTPKIPGQPAAPEDATSPVFQLEAHVPSDDGSKLATIELSTPFTEHGPEFRYMVVEMAASVSFERPSVSEESSNRISQLLG